MILESFYHWFHIHIIIICSFFIYHYLLMIIKSIIRNPSISISLYLSYWFLNLNSFKYTIHRYYLNYLFIAHWSLNKIQYSKVVLWSLSALSISIEFVWNDEQGWQILPIKLENECKADVLSVNLYTSRNRDSYRVSCTQL